jgi:microcystin-dependent protein
MAKTRRAYTGAAVESTLDGGINASGVTTITVNAATGWPYGSDPYYIVISPGTASEEKVLVTRSGSSDLNLSVASDSDRGQDGTSGVAHADQATVYPVFTSVDADEANELSSTWTTKGDLVTHGTSTFSRLAVGTNDHVLKADSSAAGGLAWGQVVTAGIADDAVTAAQIADDAVVTAGILDANVTEAKLATAVVNKLVPAGTITATIRSTADTGYLLLDGSTVASADSTYPALWAVVPASWQSGTSLVLPDMSDKMLFGQSTTTLGATGGANSKTIASANLPTHTHTVGTHTHAIDHDHESFTSGSGGAAHTHSFSATTASGGGHSHEFDDRINTTASGSSGEPMRSNNSGTDGTQPTTSAGAHSHTLSGTTGSETASHTHSINVPAFTGNSGSGGATDTGDGGFANTALDVTNAHLAVNFQIKAH